MLAHTHEPTVGGREFDDKLVQHFAAEFKRKTKFDLKESERALTKLRSVSRIGGVRGHRRPLTAAALDG